MKAADETKQKAAAEFKEAMFFYENGDPRRALERAKRAVELDNENALFVSYAGLFVAAAQKNYTAAAEICHKAIRLKRTEVQPYLNLAEVYKRAGQKTDAVEALTVGLKFTKQDVRLVRALRQLGIRRPPVFPFLERKHFLNRHFGKARHRILRLLGRE
jgi:tetratricopeptide (TPR) repeat protein